MKSILYLLFCTNIANATYQQVLKPTFEKLDLKRSKILITLNQVAAGFEEITDLQFLPGRNRLLLVLEKGGALKWVRLGNKEGKGSGTLVTLPVVTRSEMGLLGLAFHPKFYENGKVYLNYNVNKNNHRITRIAEFQFSPIPKPRQKKLTKFKLKFARTLLEVQQPYANHDAGQLAFGPDGYLYIGFGDGGSGGDPLNAGQDRKSFLGSMLRVDVSGKPYRVPKDNPFVGDPNTLPEIWAIGLRNPWRYSFDSKGRLITGDVGQYLYEEVSIIEKGKNYGWRIREGTHCFNPAMNCASQGLVDPIYQYTRQDGASITGGFVYEGSQIQRLKGKYVFGDYVSGGIWAIEVKPTKKAWALGRFPIQISTFGRSANGELFVADFGGGKIFRIRSQ